MRSNPSVLEDARTVSAFSAHRQITPSMTNAKITIRPVPRIILLLRITPCESSKKR